MKENGKARRFERIIDGAICAVIVAVLFALGVCFAFFVMAEPGAPEAEEAATSEIHPPVAEETPAPPPAMQEPSLAEIQMLSVFEETEPEPELETQELPANAEPNPDPEAAGYPSCGGEAEAALTPLGRWNVVGYDACAACCGNTNGITKSGTVATVGRTCAVKGLPFGTVLYIDGIGERVVEDRGYLADGVIDVFCEDHAACYAITGVYEVYEVIREE